MRILHRYLLRELAAPLGVWLAFLFLLLFVMQFLRGTDVLLGSAVTLSDIGKLTLCLLPHFMTMALPIALLLAILLAFGRLAEDRELIALQALGVGPSQLLAMPLLLAVTIAALMLGLFAGVEPWGLRRLKGVANELIKRNVVADVRSGVFYDDLSQLTLYTEKVNKRTGRWQRVLIEDDRDPSQPYLMLAKEAQVDPTHGEQLRLLLTGGQLHRAGRETDEYTVIDFDRGEVDVGLEDAVTSKERRFQSPGGKEGWSLGDLVEAAEDARSHGVDARPFWMAFHWRLGQALSPLAFALFGLPLAMIGRPGARARGFMLTLLGYVGYHLSSRTFENLGLAGEMPTAVAGQLSNVLFAVIGIVLIATFVRSAGRR